MTIGIEVHNISAPEEANPAIREQYLGDCTVRYFTFTNSVGSAQEQITVRLFDYSDAARRDREDMTYSWGASR